MTKFRLLRADEIEARVAMVKPNGLQILLYKDARCDMNILDETVGAMNWTRNHSRDNANCIVAIWDPDKNQWVEKEDTGTESNTEAEKGLASDSFKRACFNWGIGRELYTAPFCWFPADDVKISGNKCFDKFEVTGILYDERRQIKSVTIMDTTTKKARVFRNGAEQLTTNPPKEMARQDNRAVLKRLCLNSGVHEEFVAGLYKKSTLDELPDSAVKYLITTEGWEKALRRFMENG